MPRALVVLALLVSAPAAAAIHTVGQPATELDIAVDAAGKPFKLAALRGRWIVLSVGAAWCGPCQDELPVWNKLAGELRGKVTFISLALDNDLVDGKAFHQRLGVPNLMRAYLPEEKSQVAERYGAQQMPATFVIDPRGVIRYIQLGFDKRQAQREYQRLRSALEKLLPKPRPPAPKPGTPPPPPPIAAPVSAVPALVLPDQPHAALWADHWPALPF